MQVNLESDITIAKKLLYRQTLDMEERMHYGQISPFSNENI